MTYLEALEKQLDAMPIFGDLREDTPNLKFGQYLTELKLWFDKTREKAIAVRKALNENRDRLNVILQETKP